MSGHSKWSSIKHKKALVDAKRGKVFTKLIREITIIAKTGGGDLNANARLRLSVQKAKEANMPAANIERAIKKGTGELPGVSYEELVYEGYLPYGIACVIDILTDNKNRTVADIRKILSKNGGSLGESGSVLWMFEKKGIIIIKTDKDKEEEIMELSIEHDALNVEPEDDITSIYTAPLDFENMKNALTAKTITIESSNIERIPTNLIKLKEEQADRIIKIVEILEEQDDVQIVSTNFDF